MAMKKPVKKGKVLTAAESKAMAKGKMGQKSGFGLPGKVYNAGGYGQGKVKFNYVTESEKKANTARRLNPKKK